MEKVKMSYFIILRGPASVGKSSIAEKLSKRLNALLISFDDVLRKNKLDSIGGDGISSENFLKANKLVLPKALAALRSGQIVIFDGCFYRKKQILDITAKLKYSYKIISLTASLNVCLKRNKERKKPLTSKAVREVYALVEKLPRGIKLDVGSLSVGEAVERIVKLLPSA